MPPHYTELIFISLINFKLGRRRPNQPPSTYLTCHWLVLQLPISRLIMHDNSTIPIATTRPSTFPHFPRLPCQLREKIWEMAIRPDSPAVHRFSLHHQDAVKELTTRDKVILHYGDSNLDISGLYDKPRGNVYGHYRLCAPRTTTTSNSYSWSKNNMSAYMWDAGLWGEQVPNLGG